MDKQKKIELLADMLELEPDELNEDTVLDDLDEWDSMNALNLIVLIDENFGKTITADVVNSFETIGDVLKIME